MVKVSFRAQGHVERSAGEAIARRGSKLLIRYRIQSGAERERWLGPDRCEVVEGDASTLPVIKAEKNARAFRVTLPDGTTKRANGTRDQDRPAGTSYSLAARLELTAEYMAEQGVAQRGWEWHGYYKCATRAEAEAEIAKRFPSGGATYGNGREFWAVVEVVELVAKGGK